MVCIQDEPPKNNYVSQYMKGHETNTNYTYVVPSSPSLLVVKPGYSSVSGPNFGLPAHGNEGLCINGKYYKRIIILIYIKEYQLFMYNNNILFIFFLT